ncbi:MAG: PD40 domain-containing protein [Prevotellaceae bacterium]|nr:PD40 domain-containing protein [Candidatus Minthosoma caballi]
MKLRNILSACAIALIIAACGHPSVPTDAKQESRLPKIYPDYTEVTIPCNICPLNFAVQEGATEAVARLTYPGGELTYGEDCNILIDESEWKDMLEASKGKSIKVDVFAKVNGSWIAYKPFNINVAEDPIDQYISYRLIQPSYVAYEQLSISQRDLTSFEEKDIYNNMSVGTEKDGQCINCHSYKNYKTDNMLFHMRQALGGTMLVSNGEVKKIDLKTEQTISAGVYPAWHPTENLIAFSTNKTGQSFHTKDLNKIEVQDTYSDLILYDVDKNEVSIISELDDELEVFPTWSPDGKKLYFCSAHFEYLNDSIETETEMIQRYREVQYDIYAADFDAKTKTFSNMEKIYDAAAIGKSATLPRISPDGKYLLFAQANYGCFHVWHNDADIFILDLNTKEAKNLKEVNSDRSESYPTWSSNGRWIMVDSRRDDGNYTRPFIAYFDKNGKAHKAFEVPQKDPNFYTYFLRSYNRPEFMIEPVKVTPQEFAKKAKEDAIKASFAN